MLTLLHTKLKVFTVVLILSTLFVMCIISCSAYSAAPSDILKKNLNVGCQIAEEEISASPYINGRLDWNITIELANTGKESLRFGDDMILMDSSPEQDYSGAYVVYQATGSSGGAWGEDYYARAHNYVISNYYKFWPDGSMVGFSDGGTHHMGTPPEFKAPKSACNTQIVAGEKARYSTTMNQGVWIKRELSSRVLLVLPEIQIVKNAPTAPRYRIILTLKRSDKAKNTWELKDKSIVSLETSSLKQLLTNSHSDNAMRILALNWLADVDKEAATPFILKNIKKEKDSRELVASIQLLGYYNINPDPETLQAIKTIAAGGESWSQKAAARYIKEKVESARNTAVQ